MAKKSAQRNSGDLQNVLYVVLHGLVCLVDNGAGFTGYLLDRSEDTRVVHEYKAGTFRQENDLDERETLQLDGTDGTGTKKLSPKMNPVLKKPIPQDQTFFARNKILLKYPNAILHFVCGDPGNSLNDSKNELVEKKCIISGTRVFQYSFTNYNDVKVRGDKSFFWQCPNPATTGGYAVFQLYNEPEFDPGGVISIQHSLFEFNDSLIYMQAKSVQLRDAIVKPVPGDTVPPGLTADQVCPLDMRDIVAAQLRLKRKKKDFNQFIVSYGKMDLLGGAGGTQVCGGVNG